MKSLSYAYQEPPDEPKPAVAPLRPAGGHDVDDDTVDLWAQFDLVWQGRWWIAAGTVAALAVAVVISTVQPRLYRATATVFVTPPTYATTLRAETMSVGTYEKLAESDFVVGRVEERLRQQRPDLFPQGALAGGRYDAKFYTSHDPQKPYLPLLELAGESDSAEKAQQVANTWATVFVAEQGNLAKVSRAKSADFILSQLPETEQSLAQSETKLEALSKRQAGELATLESELDIPLKKAQAESYDRTVVTLESALSAARTELNLVKPTVEELTRELTNTPQFIEVNRAMSQDAAWQAAASQADKKTMEALSALKLKSQEVNPVHEKLRDRLATERVRQQSLVPHIAALEKQIAQTRQTAFETRRGIVDGERRIADMKRLHEVNTAELRRAVSTSKVAFDKLAEKFGEAKIAKFEPDNDLKLGGLAGLPAGPSSPNVPRNLALGTGLGFAVSLIAVWLTAVVSRHREQVAQTARA